MPRNRPDLAQTATYREALISTVAARLEDRLDELVGSGVDLQSLGSPEQVAGQLVAALPRQSHAYDLALGPFYDTAGLTRWLGVSRQALSDRVRRGSLLACRTDDGHLVYPAFQFDSKGAIRRSLAPVLKAFAGHDGWAVAAWIVEPTSALEGESAMDWLALGRDPDRVAQLAHADAVGWAA